MGLPDDIDGLEDEGEVARGGYGAVHVAHEPDLERRVAVKILHQGLGDGAAERFAHEARITARLDHPYVVPVHRLSAHAPHWFTMKLVDGCTLDQVGDLGAAVEALAKACDALGFAHAQGLLHGDIKPENLLVGAFGALYVMDWGLARDFGWEGEGSGTPAYMAPEQARGEPLDARTDVFGLGATLYHLLAQEPPYAGGGLYRVLRRAREADIERPPGPDLLVAAAMRALSADPAERYQTAAAFRADLMRWLRSPAPPETVRFSASEVVFNEGDPGDAAFVVTEGEVAVTVGGREVRRLGPGEVFGETAVFADSPRTASVTATRPTVAVRLTRERLVEEAQGGSWMALVVRALAERFREVDGRLRELQARS
jgi:serine/threonine-protein kinase